MALVLKGTVATMDPDGTVLPKGAVFVDDDGLIEAVQSMSKPAPPGYSRAKKVETGGVIYPGLIDLHSHMGYNALPLFSPPKAKYDHHDQWNTGERYSLEISWPSNVLLRGAPEASLKYAQVKALVGGTTAIQGKPKASRAIDGWLVRIIDDEQFDLPGDIVHAATIPREDPADLLKEAKRLAHPGAVYIPHLAEGIPSSKVHAEFDVISQGGCLLPGLIAIHCTALTEADFKAMGKGKGTFVWSPYSNHWLYGQTTDVPTALARGVRVCLGSDWSPSGTKHVLAELKVASMLNDGFPAAQRLDARELCELVTANPGDALAVAWGQRIGRIRPGSEGDLVVLRKAKRSVYDNLIAARETDVHLVLVRGKPYYGTATLMKRAGAANSETIGIAGEKRKIVVSRPDSNDAKKTWKECIDDLDRVRADPVKAWDDANGDLAAWGGSLSDPDAPLLLLGDMPDGDAELLGALKEPPANLVVAPLDPLWHDKAFFATTKARSPDTLGPLEEWYT